MWKFKAILIGFLSVVIFGAVAQISAAKEDPSTKVVPVSGVISWIDIKAGKLQLAADASRNRKDPIEYRINQNSTFVTEPTHKKFLKLEDLRVGQYVVVEFNYIPGEWVDVPVAQKIIANPIPEPIFQVATGQLNAIDAQAGTFSIIERPLPSEGGTGKLSYFIFDPNTIVVMKSPSLQPVALVLKPGDLVQVEFVVNDGKRYARSITLLSAIPETTSTTTTTTTSTTTN
jgi:hypothetical protein